MDRIDEEDAMMDEVTGTIEWYRISLSIPAGERHRRIEFQQAMLNKFMERIPNFADKDVRPFLSLILAVILLKPSSSSFLRHFSQI